MLHSIFAKACGLEDHEIQKLLPFFLVYLLLFAAVTLAEGVALSLFLARLGSAQLPHFYGVVALCNLGAMALYMFAVTRISSSKILQVIIAVSIMPFIAVLGFESMIPQDSKIFGSLLVTREIFTSLALLHFGNYLQDFLGKQQLVRMLPVIYTGGRIGGLLAATVLTSVTGSIGVRGITLVLFFCNIGCIALVRRLNNRLPPPPPSPSATTQRQASYQFMISSPFVVWLTISGVLFTINRWFLNFESSTIFGQNFQNEVELAELIGFATQIGLVIAIVIQSTLVPRFLSRFGVLAGYNLYGAIMLLTLGANALFRSIPLAIFSRFVEVELRYSLRNPTNQLLTNHLPLIYRKQVRTITMGVVIPVSTLFVSYLLGQLQHVGHYTLIGVCGLVFGLLYIGSGIMLKRTLPKDDLSF